MPTFLLLAQEALQPSANLGIIVTALGGTLAMVVNAVREELEGRRSHERAMRRITQSQRCRDVAEQRDEWIVLAIAKHPDLGPLPKFLECAEPSDDDDHK